MPEKNSLCPLSWLGGGYHREGKAAPGIIGDRTSQADSRALGPLSTRERCSPYPPTHCTIGSTRKVRLFFVRTSKPYVAYLALCTGSVLVRYRQSEMMNRRAYEYGRVKEWAADVK